MGFLYPMYGPICKTYEALVGILSYYHHIFNIWLGTRVYVW